MQRHGEDFKIDNNLMDTIATYMDDDTRESVHFDLAPCTPEEFIIEYVKRDPEFEELLRVEFSIELQEIRDYEFKSLQL